MNPKLHEFLQPVGAFHSTATSLLCTSTLDRSWVRLSLQMILMLHALPDHWILLVYTAMAWTCVLFLLLSSCSLCCAGISVDEVQVPVGECWSVGLGAP